MVSGNDCWNKNVFSRWQELAIEGDDWTRTGKSCYMLLVGTKCICGRGSAPNPAGGACSTLPDSLAGGKGARWHLPNSPRTAPLLSTFGLEFRSFGPQESPPPKKDVVSMSTQNCCKGLCFTEKVEKHCYIEYYLDRNWQQMLVSVHL